MKMRKVNKTLFGVFFGGNVSLFKEDKRLVLVLCVRWDIFTARNFWENISLILSFFCNHTDLNWLVLLVLLRKGDVFLQKRKRNFQVLWVLIFGGQNWVWKINKGPLKRGNKGG